MGKRFEGGQSFEGGFSSKEKSPEEKKEILDNIFKILARLIETGADLSTQTKKNLRQQIQGYLLALGLKGLDDIVKIQGDLLEQQRNLPLPNGYPTKDTFIKNLNSLYVEKQESILDVPTNPSAVDVAKYGQCDWKILKGRDGKQIIDYLYDLGKVMSSEFIYTSVFDKTDVIEIGNSWNIENGRHRVNVLKVLGSEYVQKSGLSDWVPVKREQIL